MRRSNEKERPGSPSPWTCWTERPCSLPSPRPSSASARLDVLVNNAIYQGPGTLARFADLTDGELSALFEGNVVAQLALIRAALPHLQSGGTIVNLVSGAGHLQPPAKVGEGGWSVGYAMTKAAFGRVAPVLHVEYPDVRFTASIPAGPSPNGPWPPAGLPSTAATSRPAPRT